MGFKKTYAFLIVFLTFGILYGQQSITELEGRVFSVSNDVSAVHVSNISKNKGTITDKNGFFEISVIIGDTLVFSAVQFKKKEIVITQEVLDYPLFLVALEETLNELNEVVVMPYNLSGNIDLDIDRLGVAPVVTSSTLDLPNADVEKMTQSERLLIEADRGKYFYYYVIALKINLHKILNKASGRTKSLEEMVARDENMKLEKEIITKFSKETIAESFDIPEANIDAFLTYCMSQEDFSTLSQAGNMEDIWQYLKAKSVEFNKVGDLKD